tara:strand:+ start:5793 stop:6635 length:843 start_codon:yes stop_codon:yes gene_type:complete
MYRHLPYQPKLAYTDKGGKLVIMHSSGFFSCCSIRLRKIINWFNEHEKMPIVDSSNQWQMYKDTQEDVSTKFFTTTNIDIKYTNHIDFSTDTIEDQVSNYSLINFNKVGNFIKKYFTVSDKVKILERQLIDKYQLDVDKTIAVCYRGTDKKTEINIPTYHEMFDKIQAIQLQYPNHKLLIQSDEKEFIDASKIEFPNHIHFHESIKVSSNQKAVQFYITPGDRVYNAQLFLAIMQILSKCSKVILNSGNVGMWVCLFRNNTSGVSQYLKSKTNLTDKVWI